MSSIVHLTAPPSLSLRPSTLMVRDETHYYIIIIFSYVFVAALREIFIIFMRGKRFLINALNYNNNNNHIRVVFFFFFYLHTQTCYVYSIRAAQILMVPRRRFLCNENKMNLRPIYFRDLVLIIAWLTHMRSSRCFIG